MADEEKSQLETPKRMNYYDGQPLTAESFQTEQNYFINKQRLINRLIHGSGVVCGLDISEEDNRFIISPGIAIDCKGREIIVTEKYEILKREINFQLEKHNGTFHILLNYNDCYGEMEPVISTKICKEECAPNKICEEYNIFPEGNEGPSCDISCDNLCYNWLEDPRNIKCECETEPENSSVTLATFSGSSGKYDVILPDRVYSNPLLYELINCVKDSFSDITKGPPGPGLEKGVTIIESISPITTLDGPIKEKDLRELILTFSNELHEDFVKDVDKKGDSDIATKYFEIFFFVPEEVEGLFSIHHIGDFNIDIDQATKAKVSLTLKDFDKKYEYFKEHSKEDMQLHLRVKCDFIKDWRGNAIAGHHLLNRGKSGLNIRCNEDQIDEDPNQCLNIQGGIFESIFYIE